MNGEASQLVKLTVSGKPGGHFECFVMPGRGIRLEQADIDDGLQRTVEFGEHMIDVIRKLGNPTKERPRPGAANKQPLHFLNYCELGLDLGFTEDSHRLSKVILRANQLADPIFGFYDRCNF